MKTIALNSVAVMLGLVIGSIVNMTLIESGNMLIPLPVGADNRSVEALSQTIHLFGPQHYLFPFLAHAAGSFTGALIATLVAPRHAWPCAITIGAVFLLGGLMMVMMLPSPFWFNALDLCGAYLPMAWLGYRIGKRFRTLSE